MNIRVSSPTPAIRIHNFDPGNYNSRKIFIKLNLHKLVNGQKQSKSVFVPIYTFAPDPRPVGTNAWVWTTTFLYTVESEDFENDANGITVDENLYYKDASDNFTTDVNAAVSYYYIVEDGQTKRLDITLKNAYGNYPGLERQRLELYINYEPLYLPGTRRFRALRYHEVPDKPWLSVIHARRVDANTSFVFIPIAFEVNCEVRHARVVTIDDFRNPGGDQTNLVSAKLKLWDVSTQQSTYIYLLAFNPNLDAFGLNNIQIPQDFSLYDVFSQRNVIMFGAYVDNNLFDNKIVDSLVDIIQNPDSGALIYSTDPSKRGYAATASSDPAYFPVPVRWNAVLVDLDDLYWSAVAVDATPKDVMYSRGSFFPLPTGYSTPSPNNLPFDIYLDVKFKRNIQITGGTNYSTIKLGAQIVFLSSYLTKDENGKPIRVWRDGINRDDISRPPMYTYILNRTNVRPIAEPLPVFTTPPTNVYNDNILYTTTDLVYSVDNRNIRSNPPESVEVFYKNPGVVFSLDRIVDARTLRFKTTITLDMLMSQFRDGKPLNDIILYSVHPIKLYYTGSERISDGTKVFIDSSQIDPSSGTNGRRVFGSVALGYRTLSDNTWNPRTQPAQCRGIYIDILSFDIIVDKVVYAVSRGIYNTLPHLNHVRVVGTQAKSTSVDRLFFSVYFSNSSRLIALPPPKITSQTSPRFRFTINGNTLYAEYFTPNTDTMGDPNAWNFSYPLIKHTQNIQTSDLDANIAFIEIDMTDVTTNPLLSVSNNVLSLSNVPRVSNLPHITPDGRRTIAISQELPRLVSVSVVNQQPVYNTGDILMFRCDINPPPDQDTSFERASAIYSTDAATQSTKSILVAPLFFVRGDVEDSASGVPYVPGYYGCATAISDPIDIDSTNIQHVLFRYQFTERDMERTAAYAKGMIEVVPFILLLEGNADSILQYSEYAISVGSQFEYPKGIMYGTRPAILRKPSGNMRLMYGKPLCLGSESTLLTFGTMGAIPQFTRPVVIDMSANVVNGDYVVVESYNSQRSFKHWFADDNDQIQITLMFDENISVVGSPKLEVFIYGRTKKDYATVVSSTSSSVTFQYTVKPEDYGLFMIGDIVMDKNNKIVRQNTNICVCPFVPPLGVLPSVSLSSADVFTSNVFALSTKKTTTGTTVFVPFDFDAYNMSTVQDVSRNNPNATSPAGYPKTVTPANQYASVSTLQETSSITISVPQDTLASTNIVYVSSDINKLSTPNSEIVDANSTRYLHIPCDRHVTIEPYNTSIPATLSVALNWKRTQLALLFVKKQFFDIRTGNPVPEPPPGLTRDIIPVLSFMFTTPTPEQASQMGLVNTVEVTIPQFGFSTVISDGTLVFTTQTRTGAVKRKYETIDGLPPRWVSARQPVFIGGMQHERLGVVSATPTSNGTYTTAHLQGGDVGIEIQTNTPHVIIVPGRQVPPSGVNIVFPDSDPRDTIDMSTIYGSILIKCNITAPNNTQTTAQLHYWGNQFTNKAKFVLTLDELKAVARSLGISPTGTWTITQIDNHIQLQGGNMIGLNGSILYPNSNLGIRYASSAFNTNIVVNVS